MLELFGIGNAIVDIEVNIHDDFLSEWNIPKGQMILVDAERTAQLIAPLKDSQKNLCSGGSAANTTFAVQAFGASSAYTCKVADDEFGRYYLNEFSAAGLQLNGNALTTEARAPTGQCLILISDDAQRTMNTHLGVSVELSVNEVEVEALRQSRYFYVEGYLAASEPSTAAAVLCRETAEAAGVKTCISISDTSMVEFCREGLEAMLGNGVDCLFCNEIEALGWAGTDRLDIAVAELKDIGRELYVTLGANGCRVITRDGDREVAGVAAKAVDTTGAGDMFAGACLYARMQDADPADATRFANYSAANIVSRYGARLENADAYQQLKAAYIP